MINWPWSKKEPERAPEKSKGFFSTHAGLRDVEPADVQGIIDKAFPRKASEFLPKGARPSLAVAMDSNDSDFIKPNFQFANSASLTQIDWYASQSFIGYQLCALIAQHWLVDKACSMPARDAARHGYEVTINDGTKANPDFLDKIRELDEAYKIKHHCKELVRWGRIFGIRIALPIVEYGDPDDAYMKPFNLDGVTPGSYKGISQIDPYWIFPELDGQAAANPASMHFYEPTWWRVNGRRIHRSHLIIYRTCEVADILKPTYLYGGVPLTQQLAERVYAAERTANEAPMLALSKRSTIIHADLAAALANQGAFDQRMRLWSAFRDNYGIKVLGSDETAEQFDTSLADFDSLIMTQFQLVAAIAGVPATKLIETSPKGFDATGEFEQKSYSQSLESIQDDDFNPLLRRHHQLVMKSLFPEQKVNLVVKWNPVDTPTAKELAEINEIKSRTDENLVNATAIDGTDVRNRIIADKTSGYNGIPAIVPGGPGDREAEQEREQQELDAATAKAKGDEANGVDKPIPTKGAE